MSNDEDNFSLRDKIALSILRDILLIDSKDSHAWTLKDYANLFDNDVDGHKCIKAMERKIRAAYKFADMMRKIRLSSFD